MIGLFSNHEDRALIDEVIAMAKEPRTLDQPRDSGR
jgi:hypothetical protein